MTLAKIESIAHPGQFYAINRTDDTIYCTCPAWRFHRAGESRTCKHIRYWMAGLPGQAVLQ